MFSNSAQISSSTHNMEISKKTNEHCNHVTDILISHLTVYRRRYSHAMFKHNADRMALWNVIARDFLPRIYAKKCIHHRVVLALSGKRESPLHALI